MKPARVTTAGAASAPQDPLKSGESPLLSLPAVFFVCVSVFVIVLCFYAGNRTLTVALVALSSGASAFSWILSMTLLGYGILKLLRMELYGGLAFATAAGLGLGMMSLLLCGLGMAGLLSSNVVFGLELTCALIGLITISRSQPGSLQTWLRDYLHQHSAAASTSQWMWIIAMPSLAIAVVGACITPGLLWRPDDPHPYDVLVYHLQVPREWYEMGRIVGLHHNVYSYFPFNTEMHFLAAMYLKSGPWAGMYSAQFMSLCFCVLAVLAVYSCVQQRSAEPGNSSPVIAAVLMAVIPWTVMVSSVAYVESLLLLYSALTLAWTLRAIQNGGAEIMRSLLIAGLMAGFASGVKLTAVPMLLLAVPMAVVGVSVARRYLSPSSDPASEWTSLKKALAGCVTFMVAGLLVFSPWLIRNLVWTGNPLFPVAMNALGHADYSIDQVERFRLAHSAKPSLAPVVFHLAQLFSQVIAQWRYGYALWPLALLAVFQRRRESRALVCITILLAMTICWIAFTHLMSRFFVAAIPVAAILIGEIRWGRLRWAGAAIVIFTALIAWFAPDALHSKIDRFAALGREGVFGIENFAPMVPDDAIKVEQEGTGPVFMIGDSQAFLHQIPMSRLHYRTVFDLNMTGLDPSKGRDVLSCWAGMPLDQMPADATFYIDPAELERLSQTYYKVPNLPADIPGPRDRPFVIDPKTLPRE